MHVQRFSDNGGDGDPFIDQIQNQIQIQVQNPSTISPLSGNHASCSKTPGAVGGHHEDPLVGLHTLPSRFTQQQLSSTVTLTQSGYKTPASDVTHYLYDSVVPSL